MGSILYFAVFFISLSSLGFEVLLTRVFSIGQWHHLSFMVISIALFGFAASGTCLSLMTARRPKWLVHLTTDNSIRAMALGYVLTAMGSFGFVNRLPLDYFSLPVDSIQALYLLAAFCTLSLPFFFAGMILSLAYTAAPEKSAVVYLASMIGSALGAGLPALGLRWLAEAGLVSLTAAVPLLVCILGEKKLPSAGDPAHRRQATGQMILHGTALLAAGAAVFLAVSPAGRIRPAPYKAISQMLRYPDTCIVDTANDIRGRVDRVVGPYIRFAPGLSLTATARLPGQQALFTDGDNGLFLYDIFPQGAMRFARSSLAYAGYRLVPDADSALLITDGGGSAVATAMAASLSHIIIVVRHPATAKILSDHYRRPVTCAVPRAFLSGRPSRYDIIQVENWGPSLIGASALDQRYLFTVPAFAQYIRHLKDTGVLIIARKLLLPPSDTLRLWASAWEGLQRAGIRQPQRHIAMLRNWDTFVLIVSRRPMTDSAALEAFAERMNFDGIFWPGMDRNQANRFNRFDAPFHFEGVRRLAAAYGDGTGQRFFASYYLDVRPQTDDRPFPGRFLKWTRAKTLYKSTGCRLYSLMLSGEVLVAVIFAEATILSALLLVFPLRAARKSGVKTGFFPVAYFLSIGTGFMFLELFFIKSFTFFFGDPVVSFTAVVSGMLVFSGVGGYLTEKMGPVAVRAGLLLLIAYLAGLLAGLPPLAEPIIARPMAARTFITFLFLAPAGLLAGLPFPLAMRHFLHHPVQRAHAWAANGCASVLSAVAAAQIAVSFGIWTLCICATIGYLAALACVWFHQPHP